MFKPSFGLGVGLLGAEMPRERERERALAPLPFLMFCSPLLILVEVGGKALHPLAGALGERPAVSVLGLKLLQLGHLIHLMALSQALRVQIALGHRLSGLKPLGQQQHALVRGPGNMRKSPWKLTKLNYSYRYKRLNVELYTTMCGVPWRKHLLS